MSFAADHYARAITSSDLRTRADHRGDADALIAVGWCGNTLGALLQRARTEFDRAQPTPSRALQPTRDALLKFTRKQASLLKLTLDEPALRRLSDGVLDVVLRPACPTCHGRRFTLLMDTGRPTLSDTCCATCHGTGRREVRCRNAAEHRLVREVQALIADKAETLARRMGQFLR